MSLDDEELSRTIRAEATRHPAPEQLRAAIRMQAALVQAREADGTPARRSGLVAFGWGRAAAGFALGVAFALVVPPLAQRLWPEPEPLEAELVSRHVQALRTGPLVEVASSDRHTVKPWFQGRLDYAPPVFDLAAEGYPLEGGRVERVRGQAVAVLSYRRDRHVIELFVWPAETRSEPVAVLRRGFNLLHWSDGAMQAWAVSDVERAQLAAFAALWAARAAAAN